ncbi:crotonase/enoyl-CoA hydratase family protein [Fontimonas sp. SYSU GA230001]|uniref:crotonase/enoyl-CoA hydratase family protein n=1 Tax=Fontimonas sp. SYSU GA230001 TaxID=3142450 RepID=UPI0032B52C4F
MEPRVLVEVRDGIATVTMNRPDKINGLDYEMFVGLVDAARRIRRDRSVRAVILRGAGRGFCAGLDFKSWGRQRGRMMRSFIKWGFAKTNLYQRAAWCWRELPVPVIAVVHGACYGGGLQIALGADFRIATPDADLSVMEAKWGLIPDMSGSVSLRELLPMDQALRLTMTGERFSGLRANELGLVTEIADDPLSAAQALARQLATRSPDALALTKALFHRSWTASERRAFRIESALQLRLLLGDNHKEAVRANMDQRPPVFAPRRVR